MSPWRRRKAAPFQRTSPGARGKRFADGKVSLPYSHFLGYRKGADGLPEIVPEEAETVRWIYSLFLSGKTTSSIASLLTREGIPTPAARPSGKPARWRVFSKMRSTRAMLSCKSVHGGLPHQKAKEKRRRGTTVLCGEQPPRPSSTPPSGSWCSESWSAGKPSDAVTAATASFPPGWSAGDCGGYFGSKVWHSTDKYRRTIWRCNSKFTGEEKCQTPHLTEEEIKARFLDAFNTLVSDKERLLDECRTMQAALTDTGSLDSEISALLFRNGGGGRANQAVHRREFHHGTGPGHLPGTVQTAWQNGTKPPRPSWRSSRRQRPSGKPRPRTSAASCSSWRSMVGPSPSSMIGSGSRSSTP